MNQTPRARSVIRIVTRVIVSGVLLVLVAALALVGYNRLLNPWTQPPQTIEAFLRSRTPLGTSATAVQEWLGGWRTTNALRESPPAEDRLVEAPFGPGDVYPVSKSGGAKFIQAVVMKHRPWLVQQEYVVAFYSFDESGALMDISVRIDRDGP